MTKKSKEEYEKFLNNHKPNIKVLGVGGAGGNNVVRLVGMGFEGTGMVGVITDA